MISLKPLDIVVALKIGLNERRLKINNTAPNQYDEVIVLPLRTNSVGDLSEDLNKSKGDLSRAINRLLDLGLIGERKSKDGDIVTANRKYYSIRRDAITDLLSKSVRHIFAPEKKGVGRGLPTGWNCPYVSSPMNPPEIPLVWAMPGGDQQGELIEPLYPQAPDAALRDKDLYALLSLIDIVRIGKPREIQYAKDLLSKKISGLHS